jgi:hypothetical protein
MSTITAPSTTGTSTSSQPFRRGAAIAVSAIVVLAAAIALTVWLLVQSPTHHAKVTAPPQTNVQQLGGAGQGNNGVCPPAPDRHFC